MPGTPRCVLRPGKTPIRSDSMSGRRVRTLFPPCAAASHGRPAHLWRHHAPGQACRDGARRTWQRGAHHGRHKHMGALALSRCMASAPPPPAPASQHTTHTRTQRRAAAWRPRANATGGAAARAPTPPGLPSTNSIQPNSQLVLMPSVAEALSAQTVTLGSAARHPCCSGRRASPEGHSGCLIG